jgi:hypothetical protein
MKSNTAVLGDTGSSTASGTWHYKDQNTAEAASAEHTAAEVSPAGPGTQQGQQLESKEQQCLQPAGSRGRAVVVGSGPAGEPGQSSTAYAVKDASFTKHLGQRPALAACTRSASVHNGGPASASFQNCDGASFGVCDTV